MSEADEYWAGQATGRINQREVENFHVEKGRGCSGCNCDWECACCSKCSDAISNGMQHACYKLGGFVGRFAVVSIIGAILVAGALGSGVLMLDMEERPEVLWLPVGSIAERDADNAHKFFPTSYRVESVFVSADNILTPEILKKMLTLDTKLKEVNNGTNASWESLCVKITGLCLSRNILELWSFNSGNINSLTVEMIQNDVNNINISPVYNGNLDIGGLLGGIKRDGNGKIVSATSASMTYFVIKNETEVDGEIIWRDRAINFEGGMLDILQSDDSDLVLYYYLERTYIDEFANRGATEALILLAIGYGIMVIFVVIVIGKFNRLEQRFYLTAGGLLAIGMSLVVSVGFGTYLGFFYGPIQNILALLLLGIGVDDIFIITSALDRLPEQVRLRSSGYKQVALAMRHGGVSITVTSLTDFAAFAIGASTILPALRSFCVYCAIGLLFMYIMQITFFAACLSIDRWRVVRKRDACLPCIRLGRNYQSSECSQKSLVSWFFKKIYSRIVTNIFFKVVVIIVALGLAAMGIYGSLHMEVKTEFIKFFPVGTYPRDYLEFLFTEHPNSGLQTNVFFSGDVDYHRDYEKVDKLHLDLEGDFHIRNGSIQSWYLDYRQWVKSSNNINLNSNGFPETKELFASTLKQYVLSDGLRYLGDINFDEQMTKIQSSRITLTHANTLGETKNRVQALDNIRKITNDAELGEANCFPYVDAYIETEVDKTIGAELLRNLGLALVCVAVVTLILIANIITCFIVLLVVVLTLVNVGGFVYFIGISIDIVSSLTLILSIGLSVDYAAHVGHVFMRQTGTRNERVVASLENIGGPVFLGGFSTFLAIAPLGFSNAFVLRTFFKVFSSVILFGLFNGLALLPALLSIIGPRPYSQKEEEEPSIISSLDATELDNPAYEHGPEPMNGRQHPVVTRQPTRNGPHHRRERDRRPEDRRSDRNNNHHHTAHRHSQPAVSKPSKGNRVRHMWYSAHFGRSIPIYNKQILAGLKSLPNSHRNPSGRPPQDRRRRPHHNRS